MTGRQQKGNEEKKTPPVPPPLVDILLRKTFELANGIEKRRRTSSAFRFWLNAAFAVLSLLIAHVIWVSVLLPSAERLEFVDKANLLYEVSYSLAHIVVGGISFFGFKAFASLLLVANRALAVYALGLVWATVTKGEYQTLLSWYLAQHPPADTVRVMCISGDRLFGSADPADEKFLRPLRPWAEKGLLDVVMPSTSPVNRTIVARWRTYSLKLKEERYKTVEDLVAEVKAGKEFLRAIHSENHITEHDRFCMWRVVILQNYCLVQNYLPNIDGDISDNLPTFVYRNTGPYSYYQTYVTLFNMVKAYPHVESKNNQGDDHGRNVVGSQNLGTLS